MTDQTTAPASSDDEDDEFIVPDHAVDLHPSVEDVEIADVTVMDDLQPEHGQDDEAAGPR